MHIRITCNIIKHTVWPRLDVVRNRDYFILPCIQYIGFLYTVPFSCDMLKKKVTCPLVFCSWKLSIEACFAQIPVCVDVCLYVCFEWDNIHNWWSRRRVVCGSLFFTVFESRVFLDSFPGRLKYTFDHLITFSPYTWQNGFLGMEKIGTKPHSTLVTEPGIWLEVASFKSQSTSSS